MSLVGLAPVPHLTCQDHMDGVGIGIDPNWRPIAAGATVNGASNRVTVLL